MRGSIRVLRRGSIRLHVVPIRVPEFQGWVCWRLFRFKVSCSGVP